MVAFCGNFSLFKFDESDVLHVWYVCFLFLVVCETPDIAAKTFVSGLDGSGWLKHIKAILDTSIFIAKVVAAILKLHTFLH